MFASCSRTLLLVAFVYVVSAHGRVYRLSKVVVTSSLTMAVGEAAGGGNVDGQNLLNLGGGALKKNVSVAVRGASSVVQDWRLVCKQLCGAGLGGVPCVAYCSSAADKAPKDVQRSNAAGILYPNKNLICQDLCGLQLGDDACNCTYGTVITAASPFPTDHNGVCSSFCDRNGATLVGCSLCKDGVADRPVALAAGVGDGGEEESVDVGATTTAEVIITTTPNWNELCVSLCKTGDGGSLCNCDLSPFFN